MDGDGLDDYVFMDENGKMTCYVNGGPDANANNGWVWIPQAFDPINTGTGAKRDQIRLAYIFGSGRADYVIVDDDTGAISVYENGGPKAGAPQGWLWTDKGNVASK